VTWVQPELAGGEVEQDVSVADLLGLHGRNYEGNGNESQSGNAAANT